MMLYGCKLSPYDIRDYKVKASTVATPLPESFELDFSNIRIKDQGSVNSCVAHAISTILEYHTNGCYHLSTNFFYGIQHSYCEEDGQGMYLRDACKIATNLGDPIQEDCPGNTEVPKCWPIAEKAYENPEIMRKAADFKTQSYYVCNSYDDIKYALVNYGPILASIQWPSDIKVDKNGVLIPSKTNEGGYHAFVIYGYNKQGFLCQNSWGKNWGNKGRFILPYEFKIREARGLIDVDNDTFITPQKKSKWANYLYKLVNLIVNLLRKLNKT